MWNPFKKNVIIPDVVPEPPTSFVIEPSKPQVKTFTSNTVQWRTGMWVMEGNRVGILHKMDGVGNELHYVDPETGETTLAAYVSLDQLRQAKFSEIPSCRCGVTLETARGLGYDN